MMPSLDEALQAIESVDLAEIDESIEECKARLAKLQSLRALAVGEPCTAGDAIQPMRGETKKEIARRRVVAHLKECGHPVQMSVLRKELDIPTWIMTYVPDDKTLRRDVCGRVWFVGVPHEHFKEDDEEDESDEADDDSETEEEDEPESEDDEDDDEPKPPAPVARISGKAVNKQIIEYLEGAGACGLDEISRATGLPRQAVSDWINHNLGKTIQRHPPGSTRVRLMPP